MAMYISHVFCHASIKFHDFWSSFALFFGQVLKLRCDGIPLQITFIDTPGYGDDLALGAYACVRVVHMACICMYAYSQF